MHPATRRLWSITALALLATAAVPGGATAAKTWFVGADGSGKRQCSRPDVRGIQAAVDRAGPGDTIVICPGRYPGPVVIKGHAKDGLTVRAARPGSVRLMSPAKGEGQLDALVRVRDANDVRLEGLRLVVRGARPCRSVGTVIEVSGESPRATVIRDRIEVAGADTTRFRRGCGYQSGIGGAAVVAYNIVEDWGLGQTSGTGIHAGQGSLVIGNTLRFGHPDESTYDWDDIHRGIAVDGAFVVGNRILGRRTAALAGDGPGTPILMSGIEIEGAAAVLLGNTIRHAYDGIDAYGPDVVLANRVEDSRWTGIALVGPGGATVAHNVVERSANLDCFEMSAEAYEEETGEASTGPNTWIGNIGATSVPPGLCVPR